MLQLSLESVSKIDGTRFTLLSFSVALMTDVLARWFGYGIDAVRSPDFSFSGSFSFLLIGGVLAVSAVHVLLIPLVRELNRVAWILLHGRAGWLYVSDVDSREAQYLVRVDDVATKAIELNNGVLLEVVQQRQNEVAREQRLRSICLTLCVALLVNACSGGSLTQHLWSYLNQGSALAVVCAGVLMILISFAFLIGLQALRNHLRDEYMGKHAAGPLFKDTPPELGSPR